MDTPSLRATVNGDIKLAATDLQGADIVALPDGTFHLLLNEQAYLAEVMHVDTDRALYSIKINGAIYEVALSDPLHQLIDQLGLDKRATHQAANIKAPMPGLVRELMVSEGETIEAGQAVVILEAMKMENIIKSPSASTVKKIHVTTGQAVDKNQVLLDLE